LPPRDHLAKVAHLLVGWLGFGLLSSYLLVVLGVDKPKRSAPLTIQVTEFQ
jgi:hypothetical protein